MSFAKVAIGCGLAALVLSACGSTAKPAAGTIPPTVTVVGHAKVDDPRNRHLPCLLQGKIPATKVGRTWLQLGSPPAGPVVNFLPTPGGAQQAQISAEAQNAEVIGSALLYPKQAPDGMLGAIETCLSHGVKG
jgi:hypothetical protein